MVAKLFTGIWRWEQSHQIADYFNWYPGEPNDFNGIDEDCVWMRWSRDGNNFPGWSDAPCDNIDDNPKSHALCETDCT